MGDSGANNDCYILRQRIFDRFVHLSVNIARADPFDHNALGTVIYRVTHKTAVRTRVIHQ